MVEVSEGENNYLLQVIQRKGDQEKPSFFFFPEKRVSVFLWTPMLITTGCRNV